jgi:enoyl-CoA hydratase
MGNVRTEVREGVAVVTLDRPPVNALSHPFLEELTAVFDSFRDSRLVRVALLHSANERAFVAGVDLRWQPPPPDERALHVLLDNGFPGRDLFRAMLQCAVPIVVAVDAPAIGGGWAIASCGDVIVASTRASFAMTEINVGLLGAGSHLMRMLGPYRARELFLTGRAVDAAYLHELGVVAHVTEPGGAYDKALDVAGEIAKKSPIALRLAKEALGGSAPARRLPHRTGVHRQIAKHDGLHRGSVGVGGEARAHLALALTLLRATP